ncbi:MAG: lasso peptide biosynthesis B2 protein [Solirubrobacteraceae bacterium]
MVWLHATGRYLTLDDDHARVLAKVAARDGDPLSLLGLEAREHTVLDGLVRSGIAVVWSEPSGLPVPRRLVAELAALHLLGRLALRIAPTWLLKRVGAFRPDVAGPRDERGTWLGFERERLLEAAYRSKGLPFVDARCLPMSVGLLFALRLHGHPARIRLAAIPEPFHAHAWVQSGQDRIETTAHAFGHDSLCSPPAGPGPTSRHELALVDLPITTTDRSP